MDSLIDIALQSLPLFFILAVIVAVYKIVERRTLSKYKRSGVARVDAMNDDDFAAFLADLLSKIGYTVDRVAPSGRGTAALILKDRGETVPAFGVRTNERIGLREVQEVIAAKHRFNAQRGLVITNGAVNYPAQAVARKESIELWDRKKLAEAMLETLH
ncbi:MAG: restriction endonuclease [Desulfovibrionales bacterium]